MEAAEQNLRQAIARDGSNAYAHNNLGVLYQRLGRSAEAKEEFRLALSLQPGLEVAQKNLESVGGSLFD
jgi:Tfp pilus assembly protein PilF